jgi:hypothetical protein
VLDAHYYVSDSSAATHHLRCVSHNTAYTSYTHCYDSRLGGSAALHLAEEGSSAKRRMVALNAEAARLTLEARNPHITAAVDSGVLVVTGWTLSSAYLNISY